MDAVIAIVTVVLTGLGGYLLGNRRLRYERLYGQRAETLSRLSELLYEMQRLFLAYTSLVQSPEADRKEQRRKRTVPSSS